MTTGNSWLYEWLDSYLVKSPRQARRLLAQPGPLATLRETAARAADERLATDRNAGQVLVAGSGLDLSGQLSCSHFECLVRDVNQLLRSVWHYFDRVVVVGPSPRYITSLWDKSESNIPILPVLDSYINLLLYLRNIGAEKLLIFTEKPDQWCEEHGDPLFNELAVNSPKALESYIKRLTNQITRDAVVHIQDKEKTTNRLGYRSVEIRHPDYFDEPCFGLLSGQGPPDKATLVRGVVEDHVAHLIGDVHLSRSWHAPLGSTVKFHERLLRDRRHELSEREVALHLNLPVLQGVDVETLIRVREAEGASFEAFRDSLRLAIRERLRAASGMDAETVAQEIKSDVITPALADIERRLAAARKVLGKKAAAGVGVGAVATTCGLLTGNPLLVTTGVGAAMTTLAAANKYFEEQRDIALSDMYFIWRARSYERE